MGVAGGAATRMGARKQHGESRAYALGMVGGKDVRSRAVLVVLKGKKVFASLTEVVAGASLRAVRKVPREALCIVRHMVVGKGVYLLGAQRVPRGVPLSAKGTVGGSGAFLKGVVFARKAYMGVRTSAWPMVVEKDVLYLVVQKALVEEQIVVSGMGVGRGAGLRTAGRVLRGVQISARRMGVGSGAAGARGAARSLLGVEVGCVPHIAAWFRRERRTNVG